MTTDIGDTITNDAQLIEMERLMRSAPEPSGLESVTMGEDGVAVTKAIATSAGHVVMWNTDTHEPSVFNMNSVRVKLRESFPDDYQNNVAMRGRPAWTATQPPQRPWRGTATCPLHESRPERSIYDQFGYPRCTRIELPNDMEAQEHLRKKHPQTWRMMNESRAEVERQAQVEDRNINRQILAKLAGVDLEEMPNIDQGLLPAPMIYPLGPEPVASTEPVETLDITNTEVTTATESTLTSSPPAFFTSPEIVTEVNIPSISTTPRPSMSIYRCAKCESNHETTSRIGKRHKKHQVQ